MSWVETLRDYARHRQMTVALIATLTIGVVLVVGYFAFLRTPYKVLFANLRTMDAATIVTALDKKKVPYRLEDGGATIKVPSELVDSTRLGVMSEDLPIQGTVGFELFNKSDMGLTEFAQRINYQRALQGELTRTIMTLDAVDTARVHLALADPTIFRDDRRPSKASVTVVTRPGRELGAGAVRGIQRLIAAAASDLSPDDVVVLDEHGKVLNGDAPAPPSPPPTPPSQEKQAVEQFYAAKVRAAVARLYPESADVRVSAGPGPGPPTAGAVDEAIDTWTPATRKFPLTVDIGFSSAMPPSQVQDQIRAAASQAAGLDPKMGDQLSFSIGAPPAPQATTPPPVLAAAPPARSEARPASGSAATQFWEQSAIAVLLVLLIGVLLVRWRSSGPRSLTADQRADYVRRLQALLDEGEAHAAPRA
jgi:flagellar M-ring protein FliF